MPTQPSAPSWRGLSRQYWYLLSVQMVESVSEWAFSALVLFWVFSHPALLWAKPTTLLVVLTLTTAPKLLAAPLSAWVVDRYPWYQTLRAAILARSLVLGGLAAVLVLTASPVAQMAALIVALVSQSVTGLVIESARSAAMQVAIRDEHREFAASLAMFSLTGISVLAATTAVSAFVWASFAVGLAVCVGFSVAGLVLLTVMPRAGLVVPPRQQERYGQNLRAGLALVLRYPRVFVVTVGMAGYGWCLGAVGFAMPMLLLGTLAGSEVSYAVITETFALAVLVGSLVVPVLTKVVATVRLYVLAAGALAVTYLGLGWSPNLWVAGVVMGLCGLAFSVFSVSQGPLLHRAVPPGRMGTVMSLLSPLRSLMQLFGAVLIFGYTQVTVWDAALPAGRFGYVASGVVLAVAAGLIWSSNRKVNNCT